ncbi:BZ3500_MvSof-1268-A1-R1_Chr8-2g10096 [Microbotryum saponariae]|uniref:BZ3500_MvSof-1268-A1-R1_Chr8-2g10096 protein n=1 Tax=Microbotryum saponariae TaxID=289078 RepID=A0A2X0NA12_9BASI|nr:BZ3500_MvSof-1268-A1-R1_Chr8-2g10096 [Microbotryum saponariae]SDA01777.1 BZ3501_MvSof-1269-A2-R1_Chr8-2g09847 [Microbotryum saponariae]
MPRKGSKRRKTRTHQSDRIAIASISPPTSRNGDRARALAHQSHSSSSQVKAGTAGTSAAGSDGHGPKVPKSFVVKAGVVGNSVAALSHDLRKVLEPNTASRLRERKSNRLRDYVSMSGPLGVTHLLVFSQSSSSGTPLASTSAASSAKENAAAENDRIEQSLVQGTTTLNLRLIRLPRGPTLSFKVLRYSLASDILRMARRPRAIGREFAQAPLALKRPRLFPPQLILSGFGGPDKQLQLMTTVFQNLFPPIHVQSMPLSSARRVVLLSYNATTRTIDFRHYVISVRPIGISKPIRRIIAGSSLNKITVSSNKRPLGLSDSEEEEHPSDADDGQDKTRSGVGKGKGVLDLSKAQDIADYILRHEGMGFVGTSDSEMSDQSDVGSQSGGENSEEDEKKGKVRLPGEYIGRGNRGKGVRGEKRAVRLVELGPRMELGLFKIEEGVGEGEVMFHEMVHKSVTEAAQLAKVHAARRKLAAERRAQQQANVEAKKAAKKAEKESKNGGVKFSEDTKEGEDGDEDDDEEDDDEDAIDSDIEFDYEKEHGLPAPSDEELLGSDTEDEEDEVEGEEQALDSDAEDSFSDQEESFVDPNGQDSEMDEDEDEEDDEEEEEEDDDDSDTDPIPISQVDFIDHPPPLAKLTKRSNAPSSSATSFKQKGFKKIDRGPAPAAVGIAKPRGPTKKELKRTAELDKKNGGTGKRARYEDDHGGEDEGPRFGAGRGRGGRGGGGGRGRGESRGRGGRGGGRGASRGSSRGR